MKKAGIKRIERPVLWFIDRGFPVVGIGLTPSYMPYVFNAGKVINMALGIRGICVDK